MTTTPEPTTTTQLALLVRDVEELLKIIKGNGKMGLVERMSCAERDVRDARLDINELVAAAKERDRQRAEFWRKVWLAVIVLVISNIGVIITILAKLIEL